MFCHHHNLAPIVLLVTLFAGISFGAPQYPRRNGGGFGRNNNAVQIRNRVNDLPVYDPFQPEKAPEVPIKLGERRCDNVYNGSILPCLLRPQLPPFSYSTERSYNQEYKR